MILYFRRNQFVLLTRKVVTPRRKVNIFVFDDDYDFLKGYIRNGKICANMF